jgi:alpha-L-fucosidase
MSYTRRDILTASVALSAGSLLANTSLAASATRAAKETHADAAASKPFQPTWNSLRTVSTPQWLRDGKFGIYTHWGVYSVPAFGKNGTWYSNHVYWQPDSPERKHHEATYGPLEKFGYKDFIPMFTGAKFDADEWADLFRRAGSRFAGPVAEHHDGFSMWDTKYSEWNAVKMGPKQDVVGKLSKSIKGHGMKFVTAFHHAENWFFFPTSDKRYDSSDPRYSGLYGPIHEVGALPSKEFLDKWKGKIIEVVDKYDPDLIWFDFGLEMVQESYKKDMLAYYFNKAARARKEVTATYKHHDLPPGVGVDDLELGQERELTYNDWITDSSVDNQGAWGYVRDAGFKSVDNLVDNLVDRVSKNGYLLLNVGPKPDGTIPDEAKERLLGLGKWLDINGEAIYGTTPWFMAGEGPTQLEKNGPFNENNELRYTAQDIRFTAKDNILYATALDWPGEKILIKSLAPKGRTWTGLYPSEIASISMLGNGKELKWEMTKEGLIVETPKVKPCDYAFAFKIVRKPPF